MPQTNTSPHLRRGLFRATVFLLIGVLTGVAWFAALMPFGSLSMLWYELSRYGFALGVLVALVSLFFRPCRAYGLGLFLVGLVLGIALWFVLVPVSLSPIGRLYYSLILFGAPLAVTSFLAMGFFLACLRSEHGKNRGEGAGGATGAPRRFGMGTLMIVVLAVSSLFAGANWLDLPPPVSIFTGAFLGIIGGFQVLMNKVPRAASVVTGAVLLPLTLAATWSTISGNLNPAVAMLFMTSADRFFVGAHFVAFGAVCGYMGGVLVAGLFLVIDLVGRRFDRPGAARVAVP